MVFCTTGDERTDLRDRALENLNTFKVTMSKTRLEAESLAHECQRVLTLCHALIPQPQQKRLQSFINQLETAIAKNDQSKMQFLCEAVQQELRNLPEEVQIVEACIHAVNQARRVAPASSNVMADKLSRMIQAFEQKDGHEANRLLRELQPEISYWLEVDSRTSSTIVTGLTR